MSKTLGRLGERIAVKYLESNGYRIIKENYRCKVGEVDIVAEEGKWLVFVEVKTRLSMKYGLPQEAVTRRKQLKLRRVAEHYIAQFRIKDRPIRFDCIGMVLDAESGRTKYFCHIPRIFS